MAIDDPNIVALIVAPILTGVIGYIVARASKGQDVRSAAEAALIGMPGPIIAEQNVRIDALTKEVARLWSELRHAVEREQECRNQLRRQADRISDLERRIKRPQ